MSTDANSIAAYSETGFWTKLRDHAVHAGYDVIEKALWLFYAVQKPEVPYKVKAAIYGALGYFILPPDMIPDPLPLVGYCDDLTAIAAAVAIAACYIDDAVKAKASAKLRDWFGAPAPVSLDITRRP